MDQDIRRRLLSAEADFISALLSGPDDIETFDIQWHALLHDWKKHSDALNEDTVDLAHSTSHRIALLAEDFFDSQAKTTFMADELEGDVAAIFDSLNIDSANHSQIASSSRNSEKISPTVWLLQNLHNPYPRPVLRESMECPPDSGMKSVSEWFTKARQRIGWTRLMRDRFNGSRSAATEAAFRAYVRDDPVNPLDTELLTAFLAIKSHAELVFSPPAVVGRGSSISTCPAEGSRSISPAPSLTFSSNTEDSEDDVPSLPILRTGQKRSISQSSEDVQCFPDERPSKRLRSQFSPFCSDSKTSIALLQHTSDPPRAHFVEESSQFIPPTLSLSHARKRCLSDAVDSDHQPKRPRGQSEKLPLSSTSDAWFDNTFEIPPPATTDSIDNNLWDISFFNTTNLTDVHVPNKNLSSQHGDSITMNDFLSNEFNSLLRPISLNPDDVDDGSSLIPPYSKPSLMDVSEPVWHDYINFDPELWNLSLPESGSPTLNPFPVSPRSNYDITGDMSLPPLPATTSKSFAPALDINQILETLSQSCPTDPALTWWSNDEGIPAAANYLTW